MLLRDLQKAARDDDVRAILTLIKLGAPINASSCDNDWTPLHVAAACNNAVAVAVLLHHGADPNTRDRTRQHAADHRCFRGGLLT